MKNISTLPVVSSLAGLALLALMQSSIAQTASVKADFQPLIDGTIVVEEVILPADGFLIVRLQKDNKPFRGPVLAAVPLPAGKHSELRVKLEPGAKGGDTLGLILHRDDGTIGTYEFEIGKTVDEPFFNGRRSVLGVIGLVDE
jgi:hypothetical protein